MNQFVTDAISALRLEANRVNDNSARLTAHALLDALEKHFDSMKNLPTANPPGKVVNRDAQENVQSLQG